MEYGISREEEARLPDFKSHADAREYFKDKYGSDFQMIDSFMIDGQKVYSYKLILDSNSYYDMIAELEANGYLGMSERYLFCSQDIQISEDGHVHIAH